jgi:hypothetical protein
MLEAVGIMTDLKEGVAACSVRRPLEETKVCTEKSCEVDSAATIREESGS